MSENANAPKSEFPMRNRPTPKPKRVRRIASLGQRTALGRFFTWLHTPEHKWEFGIKVVTLALAIAGTWLLLSQNGLLKSQNNLLESQNGFIKQQMSLEEASRRSALITLMSNIMDKVDDEIREQKSELRGKGTSKAAVDTLKFSLSQSLIGQIAALSHSFKPYRYMSGDTLIAKRSSPERGQLLITLTLLPLDTTTLYAIYKSASFKEADLNYAKLDGANLKGIVLDGADLSDASLNDANLNQAWFIEADLSNAFLTKAKLANAHFLGADLSGADLSEAALTSADFLAADLSKAYLTNANLSGACLEADLTEAFLFGANLENATLGGAILSKTDLRCANLKSAKFIARDLQNVKSLAGALNMADSIQLTLNRTHPQLFEPQK